MRFNSNIRKKYALNISPPFVQSLYHPHSLGSQPGTRKVILLFLNCDITTPLSIMKNILFILLMILLSSVACRKEKDAWIRINQLGYRTPDIKVAVLISTKDLHINSFKIINVTSGEVAMAFNNVVKTVSLDQFTDCYRLNFSDLTKAGTYRLEAGRVVSPDFRIGDDVYDGAADFLLNYMRQQRCGYNPFLKDSCHTHDGYEIYRNGDSAHIDVTGGWHDAADYLQYVATSANAVYQMLFAYRENPASFSDKFKENGLPGPDSIPDVINESKWGLDWLLKMNPAPGVMFNQIADDRDHIGFRLPVSDSANYGKGKERPVYFCTGKPQGLFKYQNRTTGIASTAGKFASAFAIGSDVYKKTNPKLAGVLEKKAIDAFSFGLKNPGVCQTAPGTAPYFYEEDNWTDDMELAAIELYKLTGDTIYYNYSIGLGRKEKVTPWIGSDTARHYQWYPFVNMGHQVIAGTRENKYENEFAGYIKQGLELTQQKASKNPFNIGIPFIWCSNNLVAAILTQSSLYTAISGDSSFAELESSHRDWLFGCNPWGTSMIVGLPENGDYPVNSHSSYVVKGGQVPGGLVDGPVYSSIFKAHSKYVSLKNGDSYAPFQTKMANYHDDYGDYTSNECTMDGTASLVYYLSAMSSKAGILTIKNIIRSKGAIVRMDTTRKEVWLTFTAHEFTDGFESVLFSLKKHNIKASFFLTGDFCRETSNRKIINRLKADGHYIGPHSDKHLLYCSWEKRDSLLVTEKEFTEDINSNYKALNIAGIKRDKSSVFLPPYEWYNDTIGGWSKKEGLKLVNNSAGTKTAQDWTFPEPGEPYYSSDSLMNDLLRYEKQKGLNGYILLIHPGTDPRRKDKFYLRLESVLDYLENKNYTFHSFSEIN
jgi:endoglucanase